MWTVLWSVRPSVAFALGNSVEQNPTMYCCPETECLHNLIIHCARALVLDDLGNRACLYHHFSHRGCSSDFTSPAKRMNVRLLPLFAPRIVQATDYKKSWLLDMVSEEVCLLNGATGEWN